MGAKDMKKQLTRSNTKGFKDKLKVRMLDAQGKALEGRYLRASTGPKAPGRIAGYYEAELPQLALQGGARKIDLHWVDFYRR